MKYQEPALTFGFVLAAVGFVVGTGYTEYESRAIDREALAIGKIIPNIEHLSTMRTQFYRIRRLARGYAVLPPEKWPSSSDLSEAWDSIETANGQIVREPVVGVAAGEWEAFDAAYQILKSNVPQLAQAIGANELERVRRVAMSGVGDPALRAAERVNGIVVANEKSAKDLAVRIQKTRRNTVSTAFALSGAGVALTIVALIFVTRVVRQKRRALEEHNASLRARAEEMEQFAGRVAHDILTPLGITSLALEAIIRGTDRPELVRSAAMRGSAAVWRTKQIVEALLEFARSGAPRSGDRFCNVSEVLHGIRSEFSKSAEEAGISLTTDGRAIDVACDPGVLNSILSNLVRNAIAYMGAAPEKRIEVRAIGEAKIVLFEVHDTGPGIAAELKKRMFEPYVRGGDSPNSGLGLGLATVKRLVEGHGGTIGVVSHPGRGTLFWFRLPRVTPTAQPTRERRRSTRFQAALSAELAAGSRWISARIVNISRGGLLARASTTIPSQGVLTVKLDAKTPVVGEGYVRRSTQVTGEQEIAIEFRRDADFIASLDRLLSESRTGKG